MNVQPQETGMLIARPRYRFSVADYERLIRLGILTKDDRVELIRGEIIQKESRSIAREHHRFSVDQYEQMIDLGILTENDRVELIRGEIIEKMSIGEFHASCVKRLNRFFMTRLAGRACVGVQDPVRLAVSEPEPDISLLVPREDDYASGHPMPEDVLLIVEVGDASIGYDRTVKGKLYAENGIAEYWIVNLQDRTLEVYRQPRPTGGYGDAVVLRPSEMVDLLLIEGVTISVAELFPPVST